MEVYPEWKIYKRIYSPRFDVLKKKLMQLYLQKFQCSFTHVYHEGLYQLLKKFYHMYKLLKNFVDYVCIRVQCRNPNFLKSFFVVRKKHFVSLWMTISVR